MRGMGLVVVALVVIFGSLALFGLVQFLLHWVVGAAILLGALYLAFQAGARTGVLGGRRKSLP